MIRRRRARSNLQVQFDPPLVDPHGLMLHQSERGRVALLGSACTTLCERLDEPQPLALQLFLAGLQRSR